MNLLSGKDGEKNFLYIVNPVQFLYLIFPPLMHEVEIECAAEIMHEVETGRVKSDLCFVNVV